MIGRAVVTMRTFRKVKKHDTFLYLGTLGSRLSSRFIRQGMHAHPSGIDGDVSPGWVPIHPCKNEEGTTHFTVDHVASACGSLCRTSFSLDGSSGQHPSLGLLS